MRKIGILLCLLFCGAIANGELPSVKLSTAGFYSVSASRTSVENFNVGWRFCKGQIKGAESETFDDSKWQLVNVPHSLDVLPLESSGGVNDRCEAWYRKSFKIIPKEKKLTWLHFEGIMGKSKIFINGKLAATQFGGFLPIHVNVTKFLKPGENTVAVWCDNRDDGSFPPGKPQNQLDFCYYGGLYRDVWLISTPDVYQENVHISTKQNNVSIKITVKNDSAQEKKIKVNARIGSETAGNTITILANSAQATELKLTLEDPKFWTPDSPKLYSARISVGNDTRDYSFGLRDIAFNGKDGFILNGKPYPKKLFGVNRHQDFAHIGMALPNSLHVRDAIKLRNAGVRVIRNAHYPQDPAFMDACDALGLFVIVNTPGWQYWSNAKSFVDGVYSDITRMVIRDRNRPSILCWEPILNETHYPSDFAAKARDIVRSLDPANGACACDLSARGHEPYDIIYRHPPATAAQCSDNSSAVKDSRPTFTREFGDCVDNWNSHNSPSRVLREWGETAQLIQANHYVHAPYPYTDIVTLNSQPANHFGGTLWHSFDHGRGYHPDNFWGGIMDAARQPKLSYFAFKAALTQPAENKNEPHFIKIANEMTPFSPENVTVFSNCDKIKLRALGKDCGTLATRKKNTDICEPVVFTNAFKFLELKAIVRARNWKNAEIYAEGFDDSGKLVATATVKPSYRRTKLAIEADSLGMPWIADGSDIMPVIVRLTDDAGTVKRLETEKIKLTVTGDAMLIDGPETGINPQTTRWGETVFLLKAGTRPGKITVNAQILRKGEQISGDATLTLETVASTMKLRFREEPDYSKQQQTVAEKRVIEAIDPKVLQQVEKDQAHFE